MKEFSDAILSLCTFDFKIDDGEPEYTNVSKGYTKEEVKAWKKYAKKPKRARGKKGKFLADDKSTKDVNEAWVGGKAPKK